MKGKPKVFYDPATDSLSINLANRPAVDNEEIAENVIVGYDDREKVVLIEFLGRAKELFKPLLEATPDKALKGQPRRLTVAPKPR